MSVDYYDYIQSAEWRERANAAKRRAGNRCQVCNRPATAVTLDAHHRTYERLGKERAEDITVLCRDCHALYEANKRLPRPPQPIKLPTREDIITSIPVQEPALLTATQPLLFVPVKSSKPAAKGTGPQPPVAPLEPDSVYRLLPASPTVQPVRPSKPVQSTTKQAARDSRIRITAILIVLAMLAAISLLDNGPRPSVLTEALRPAIATSTVATSQTAIPTAPVLAATVVPATPIPVVVPPTATAPLATATVPSLATLVPTAPLADTPQGIVNQTALVCQNPCSCSPIVRTIPSGTQVSLLETQSCGLDTWVRIGESEWLGPRFVDELP